MTPVLATRTVAPPPKPPRNPHRAKALQLFRDGRVNIQNVRTHPYRVLAEIAAAPHGGSVARTVRADYSADVAWTCTLHSVADGFTSCACVFVVQMGTGNGGRGGRFQP